MEGPSQTNFSLIEGKVWLFHIFTGRNEVVAKVMFLLVSAILLTGGGCAIPACIAGGIPACLAAGLWGCLLAGWGVCCRVLGVGGVCSGGCLLPRGRCLLWGGSTPGGPSGMAFLYGLLVRLSGVIFCYGLLVWYSGEAFWCGGLLLWPSG